MDDIPPISSSPTHHPAASIECPVSPASSLGTPIHHIISPSSSPSSPSLSHTHTHTHTPRLGDFSKLHISALSIPSVPSSPSPQEKAARLNNQPLHHKEASASLSRETSSSQADSIKGSAKLGNFSSIFSRLSHSSRLSQDQSTDEMAISYTAKDIEASRPMTILRRVPRIPVTGGPPSTADGRYPVDLLRKLQLESETEPCTLSDFDSGSSTTTTPSTSPPTPADKAHQEFIERVRERARAVGAAALPLPGALKGASSPKWSRAGPLAPLPLATRTKGEKHESLCRGIIPLRALDHVAGVSNPKIVANGVHIFVDMSNISISFQKALKAKLGVRDRDRLTHLPNLNLEFLTEILVRGRPVKVMNVGCSIHPQRPCPPFVQEMRDMGYRVDVRERKLLEQATAPFLRPGGYSSDEVHHAGKARYVEDLVDETLHIRIGESVMQYFEEQGTLVLATGDAKPAQYSDGFFVYAERALKMGWNVEVVSWKDSLSSAWKDADFKFKWADKFRVIELDPFLDDLVAAYSA